MAMISGGRGGFSSDINVTPLIDVLLVLLIIFMVIVPVVPKGLGAMVPQLPNTTEVIDSPRAIVVSVIHSRGARATYRINQDDVAKDDLLPRLTAIFANRAERVMFVKGDDDLSFAQVAEVIDISHMAGVDSVGLLTTKQ